MAMYRSLTGDTERITFLLQTAAIAPQDFAAGHPYIRRDTLDAVNALLPTFQAAVQAAHNRLSARVDATRAQAAAFARLRNCIRAFWAGLHRRAHWLGCPEVIPFYGFAAQEPLPRIHGRAHWLTMAAQAIEGDAAAAAAGYPAMVNPSAAELQPLLESARSCIEAVAQADRAYQEAQQAVAALRPRANELIVLTVLDLRYYLSRFEASERRRIMRSYGARFCDVTEGEAMAAPPVAGQPAVAA